MLSTQNELFGDENKANDHTQQLIKYQTQHSPNVFTRKPDRHNLGEFSNTSYGVFGSVRVKKECISEFVWTCMVTWDLDSENCDFNNFFFFFLI